MIYRVSIFNNVCCGYPGYDDPNEYISTDELIETLWDCPNALPYKSRDFGSLEEATEFFDSVKPDLHSRFVKMSYSVNGWFTQFDAVILDEVTVLDNGYEDDWRLLDAYAPAIS